MLSRQTCTKCRLPSLPGLVKGQGLCAFHWNAAIWGKDWALEVDHVKALTEDKQRQANNK